MEDDERVPRVPKELIIRVRPEHYLNLAHEALAQGNASGAIENYLKYIANLANPDDMKLTEQVNLTKLIMNLNETPEGSVRGLQEEIMKCYLSVLNVYPENAILSNAFGVLLFTQGEYNVSRKFLKIAAAQGYLPAEKNFLHVMWHLIPRWHFRMLNDKHRNEAYKNAITRALESGAKNVYDIGTGSGLLTLITLAADKNTKVTAFEENKTLIEVATKVFALNGVSDRVKLISANTTTYDATLETCDLIVTEIFDAGVFGEECLDTIIHALINYNSRVIPERVKVFVTGLESMEITKKTRVISMLPQLGINMCIRDAEKEPYDSDFLKFRKNIKYLTTSVEFLATSFCNLEHLVRLRTQEDCIPEVEIQCTEDGVIHALAVWFELYLDEDTVISTHPSNENNLCWEQAVFSLEHPLKISVGDVLKLKPRIKQGRISLEVLTPKSSCECIKVSKEIISFLNDSILVQNILEATTHYTNCDKLRVLDCNVFPLFGLMMAKKGATVINVYKDENDLNFFTLLTTENKFDNVVFIHEKTLQNHMVYVDPPDIVFRDVIHSDREFSFKTTKPCDFLPKKVCLNAQLVGFEYLDFCNKVDDSSTLGFKMAEVMNEYTGSEHPNYENIDPEGLFSTVVNLDISDLDKLDFHAEGKATKDGRCNGILYWFDVQLTPESGKFSTLESSFYENTCTLLKTPKVVKKDDTIVFHVFRYEGHLKVYCD